MGTILKHGSYSIESGFNIKQVRYAAGHNSYIELLIVEMSDMEQKIIVHQYGLDNSGYSGRFLECENLEIGSKIFDFAFSLYKWFLVFGKSDGVKKKITYSNPLLPWFYCPTSNVNEDTFISSN